MLVAVWIAGALSGWTGLDQSLAAAAERLLHPPRPTVAELAARVGPGDPRPEWYAAALALKAEEALAASGPETIDPNAAGRAEWDRLPGIGPVTAIAIVEHRAAHGPFRAPDDLLEVRGIGPRTLEKLRPFLGWEAPAGRGWPQLCNPAHRQWIAGPQRRRRGFSEPLSPASVQNLLNLSSARGRLGGCSATGPISCPSTA